MRIQSYFAPCPIISDIPLWFLQLAVLKSIFLLLPNNSIHIPRSSPHFWLVLQSKTPCKPTSFRFENTKLKKRFRTSDRKITDPVKYIFL